MLGNTEFGNLIFGDIGEGRIRVIINRVLRWNITGRITRTMILIWHVSGRVLTTKVLRWDIIGRIRRQFILMWHIFAGYLDRKSVV